MNDETVGSFHRGFRAIGTVALANQKQYVSLYTCGSTARCNVGKQEEL